MHRQSARSHSTYDHPRYSAFGGSAHSPRRRCAEPSQCAGQVSQRLESTMATMGPFENGRGCNTLELSRGVESKSSRLLAPHRIKSMLLGTADATGRTNLAAHRCSNFL